MTYNDLIKGVPHTLYHVRLRNSDGTPLRCRPTGRLKVWVTRPGDFRLPVRYGLKDSFYITPENVGDWYATEADAFAASVNLDPDTHPGIVADRMKEMGHISDEKCIRRLYQC